MKHNNRARIWCGGGGGGEEDEAMKRRKWYEKQVVPASIDYLKEVKVLLNRKNK